MPKSIVDDLRSGEVNKGHGGYPILFENAAIRNMLRLAGASKKDIFCDMGCGFGQNLIVAASEFEVHKAGGFEMNRKRFEKANRRIKLKGLEDRCEVIHAKYEEALDGKSKRFALEDATIVFFGLSTSPMLLESFEKKMQKGCRLVYYYNCLFPEIMPDKVDFPFYISVFPFTKTTSELEWLGKIVGKEKSLIDKGKKPSVNELWDELTHDYRQFSYPSTISDYKRRFRRLHHSISKA